MIVVMVFMWADARRIESSFSSKEDPLERIAEASTAINNSEIKPISSTSTKSPVKKERPNRPELEEDRPVVKHQDDTELPEFNRTVVEREETPPSVERDYRKPRRRSGPMFEPGEDVEEDEASVVKTIPE
jgi:hypothetical protein